MIFKQHLHQYFLSIVSGLILAMAFYFLPVDTLIKYLAAALTGAAVVFNPTVGLFIVAALLPFLPNLSLLLLGGLVGASFIFHRLWSRNFRLEPVASEPPLLLFIAAVFFFSAISIYPQGSFRDLSIYTVSFIILFVMVNQLDSKEKLYRFLVFGLMAALVVSFYGIYQYIIGVPVESAWVDQARHPLLRTRVYSVFGNPNILAEYLVMLLPFGLALTWAAEEKRKKIFFAVITGVLGLTMLLTFSRGGWVGLAAALFFFMLMKNWRYLLLLLPLLLIGIAFLPQVVLERLLSIISFEDTSNLYRLVVWREALEIIKDFWASGVGLGHQPFMDVYPFYMITRVKAPFHVHNTYLQFLVETGVIGFTIFMWLLLSVLKQGIKSLKISRDPFLKNINIAALAATIGVMTQGLGEHILYMPKIIILFWVNIAIIFTCIRLSNSENNNCPSPSSKANP